MCACVCVEVGGGSLLSPVEEIWRKDQVRMDPEAPKEEFKQTGNERMKQQQTFLCVWSCSAREVLKLQAVFFFHFENVTPI